MKKYFYILGLVSIGLLLLGGLGSPLLAQETDPFSEGPLPGTYTMDLDLGIDSAWTQGPGTTIPQGKENTNLKYNLTTAITPFDQYMNVGFVSGVGEGIPPFKIVGTIEGSDLFVKIINDQTDSNGKRLLDWQAALILGSGVTVSWQIDQANAPQGIPLDLIPTSFTIPGGSATPPLPVVRSPTNFSYVNDLSDLAHMFGYKDGFPALTPAIFILDNLADAHSFWTNVAKYMDVLPQGGEKGPDDNTSWKVTSSLTSNYALTIEGKHFNGTSGDQWENISVSGMWDNTGILTSFSVDFKSDMDHSGTFDTNERLLFAFDLEAGFPSQSNIPLAVNNAGQYDMNVLFDITVDLVNDTEEQLINDLLTSIESAVNALDGEKLLDWHVDSMDGLYYHVDGTMLDLARFLADRLGFFSGGGVPAGSGAQPPIGDYYGPLGGDTGEWGQSDFALNLFDAQTYMNSTWFYRTDIHNGRRSENDTHLVPELLEHGATWAWVYEQADWDFYWRHDIPWSIEQQMAALPSPTWSGPVTYVEVEEQYYDFEQGQVFTHTVLKPYLIGPSNTFDIFTDYAIVFGEQELAGTEFTSYRSMGLQIPLFGANPMAGLGAQVVPNLFGIPMDQLRSAIPLPMRTPDWEVVGGSMMFAEAVVDAVADVLTSPSFVEFVSNAIQLQDEGDDFDITTFTFGLDWIKNGTHAGAEAGIAFDVSAADNDTENYLFSEATVGYDASAEYFWLISGAFDTAGLSYSLNLDFDQLDYTPSTTTTTTAGISPGFEILVVFGSLTLIPAIIRRRR
ncbi:MAG: hypothetical protein ACFFE8_06900 [Candidatus Heimdallarchaeota archaeon]